MKRNEDGTLGPNRITDTGVELGPRKSEADGASTLEGAPEAPAGAPEDLAAQLRKLTEDWEASR